MPFLCQDHFRPQRPRSFWSAPRIETSGRHQHRKSAIYGLFVKSGKSDWLKIQNEYSARAQRIGSGQRFRSLIGADQKYRGLIDFRKAFDTIEWHYLEKALTHFNFGPNFLQWFKILHTDISSCVLNNGHASHFFSLERGVRQGCPLSGLLFVIGLELLARAIKSDKLIKGITIGKKEIKTSMYADDTTVFVSDTVSIEHLLNMLEKFRSISGLQVNTSKTKVLWLSSWKDRHDTPFNFNWPYDPTCALGVFFSYNTLKADKLNFDDKLRSMEKVLNIWKCRKLTLIGKINIVKTLALSKLIFNSSNLYLPPHVIDAANKMIFDFIWEGKPPKIKKSTVIGEKANGGLKMVDLGIMNCPKGRLDSQNTSIL